MRVKANQLTQFLTELARDESLREELVHEFCSTADVVEVAARNGFQITPEEAGSVARPLSEEEWAAAERFFEGDHSDNYILLLEEVPMSKDALNAFFKKVTDDESLQKKLIEFAAAEGFEFSADELSDSDLDSVAGGLVSTIGVDPKVEPKSVNLTGLEGEVLTGIKYDGLQTPTTIKINDLEGENR